MGFESISLDRNPYSNYPDEKFEEQRANEDFATNLVTAGLGVVGYIVAEGHRSVQNAIAVTTASCILARTLGVGSRPKQDFVLEHIIDDAKSRVDQKRDLSMQQKALTLGFLSWPRKPSWKS